MPYSDLRGKAALVTGAGRGLGAGIAERLVAEGMDVLCLDLDEDAVQETAARLGARAFVGDASEEATMEAAVAVALEAFGGLHVAVANAGVVHFAPVTEQTVEDWDRVIAVNLRSALLAIKHAGGHMAGNGGGSVITMSSLAGHVGFPGLTAYCASKGGVIMLSRVAALELRPAGVRVNAVLPAFVDTPMQQHAISVFEQALGEGGALAMIERMQGRMAQPQDISGVVAFLASDDARMVTGTIQIVDGGTSACLS
jgi:NAD(P)-dependent dehydrogenase (short-subunit alcohol dehydrogenase family)